MPRFHALLILSAMCGTAAALPDPPRRTLQPSDYGTWESFAGYHLSHDGRWLVYGLNLVDGDPRVVVRKVDGPEIYVIPNGVIGAFSDDSKWVAYLIGVPKKEAEKLKEEKKPLQNKLGLRNLQTGEEIVTEGVEGFHFLKGGKFLLAHRYRGESKQEGGSDLVILNLAEPGNLTVGNVVSFTPNYDESLVALKIESDSGFKGVQVLDPSNFSLKTLQWSKNDVNEIVWSKDKDTLAFLEGVKNEKKEGDWNSLMVVQNVRTRPKFIHYAPGKDSAFPKGKRIPEFAPLRLSGDGAVALFGVRDWADKKPDQKKPDENKANVEIWNVHDLWVQPYQKTHAEDEQHAASMCAYWVDSGKLVQVGDEYPFETVTPLKGARYAILEDVKPYRNPVTNGIEYRDVYLVNLQDGTRKKLLGHTEWDGAESREGKYLAYYQHNNWWVCDLSTGKSVDATGAIPSHFERVDDDHTVPEKPPVSQPVWLKNDQRAIFYDKYDAYLWKPGDITAKRVTEGYKNKLVMRAVDVDRDATEPGLDMAKPIYFSVFDENSKGSGYYLLQPNGEGKMVALVDKSVGNLQKALDGDRFMFTEADFNESPNLYITNGIFSQAKRVTKTNPQQADFAWSRNELIHYKNKRGVPLDAILIYPANYESGRSYPMVVYIYEKLSQNFHNYPSPSFANPYSPEIFAQNGYFVLMPDIVYRPRQPGFSALECVEPAVDAVLKKGCVDPGKVGIMGHSWGAYQTCFIVSQSKKFKAAVAGAPLTDLISMYGSIYWNSGTPDQEILETSQGRLEVPYWMDLKAYMANSPLFNADKITAPLLVEEGDNDGAVDWHQSQELYTTMRRMGKQMVLLVYPGENHGLAKKGNQKDYGQRLRHWFDVYLKGEKPEPWVTQGVPYSQKDQ